MNYYLYDGHAYSSDELVHYGVPGMKWGVRKEHYKAMNRHERKRTREKYYRTEEGKEHKVKKEYYYRNCSGRSCSRNSCRPYNCKKKWYAGKTRESRKTIRRKISNDKNCRA